MPQIWICAKYTRRTHRLHKCHKNILADALYGNGSAGVDSFASNSSRREFSFCKRAKDRVHDGVEFLQQENNKFLNVIANS